MWLLIDDVCKYMESCQLGSRLTGDAKMFRLESLNFARIQSVLSVLHAARHAGFCTEFAILQTPI